ncbi:helix-turn-helix domain-containing protein [Nocardia sp. CC227C]|uniref:helix-turn-helix domain-containing protein n=1 Tax=Nocardia sp. CC227C TaxID=3044562 RepID=UPI00278C3329|nr:helix-turn-helix domain-containing protein [Nocardia sp. CC227C]
MTKSFSNGDLPNDLINLRDAARLAGDVHPTTIRRWIGRNMLKAYRRGPSRLLYVSRDELVALTQPVESGGAA